MAVSPRDKKALLTLLEQAQLVYLLTRLPKKQVLGAPADVTRLAEGLDAMRAAAGALSATTREKRTGVQWDELMATSDTPELMWRRAKRVAPQVLLEMRPLLEGEPEAAFVLDLAAAAKASGPPARSRPARASRRPVRAGRSK
jgi:hypothetical protein